MSDGIFDGAKHRGPLTLDADVVVVGSGSSGSVMAAVLAEAGRRVVVLEEGAHVSQAQYGAMTPSQQMRAMWRDAGLTFALGVGDSPVINVMMGRCVGGSSALTGGVCFRTPGHVLHHWRTERGLPMFTEAHLEPFFEEVEKTIHVEEVPATLRSRSTQLFHQGATALGHELKPLRRNTRGCRGESKCNFGCPHGAKRSADLAWLPRATARGAQVWANCLVDRVTHAHGRANGVVGRLLNGEGQTAGAALTVYAPRVILAAGAYHTPLLAMASGIGRGSRQVGKNLTLHPAFRTMARFDEPVDGWRGALQSMYTHKWESEGISMTSMFLPPGVLAATMPGIGAMHRERAQQMSHLGVFGGMVHDEGGGTVRKGLGREPLVTYAMHPKDKAAVPKLMRLLAEIWFAAGAKEVFLPVLGMGPVTPDALGQLDLNQVKGRDLECSSQHPLGTCRMGSAPKLGGEFMGRMLGLARLHHHRWELGAHQFRCQPTNHHLDDVIAGGAAFGRRGSCFMRPSWRHAVESVVEVLFPPTCAACDEVFSEPTCFCERCEAEVLELPQIHCSRCAEPGAFEAEVCGHCRGGTPWEKAYAPFEHEGALARAIHRFKYEDRSDLARPLGLLLANAAAVVLQAMPGVLVPIPLHVSRFRERKYDQAALLAVMVAQREGREVRPTWLERVRETRRQVGLSETERELNVSDAFAATAQVRGADIILVDDVLTSGATARAASRVLLDAGARRVSVLTLARARRVHAF